MIKKQDKSGRCFKCGNDSWGYIKLNDKKPLPDVLCMDCIITCGFIHPDEIQTIINRHEKKYLSGQDIINKLKKLIK